jgi:hypothetical protein
VHTASCGESFGAPVVVLFVGAPTDIVSPPSSAATNVQTGEGVAVKKVTNVFSKKILAKRALREIKLLQHFRGHRNVRLPSSPLTMRAPLTRGRLHAFTIWTSPARTTLTKHISTRVRFNTG